MKSNLSGCQHSASQSRLLLGREGSELGECVGAMPKSVQGLRRTAALSRASPYDGRVAVVTKASALDAPSSAGAGAAVGMSRGQRKRTERKQHRAGKWESSTVLAHQQKKMLKSQKEAAEASMMSELEKTLNAQHGVVKPASASSFSSNKMRKEIALREAERMKAVQEHPAFIADPIAAVHTHLQQMLALRSAHDGNQSTAPGKSAKRPADAPAARASTAPQQQAPPGSFSKSHEKRMRKKERAQMTIDE